MRELEKKKRCIGSKEAIMVNTEIYIHLKRKYNKSLYVVFDITENSHDAKGITASDHIAVGAG